METPNSGSDVRSLRRDRLRMASSSMASFLVRRETGVGAERNVEEDEDGAGLLQNGIRGSARFRGYIGNVLAERPRRAAVFAAKCVQPRRRLERPGGRLRLTVALYPGPEHTAVRVGREHQL